ncbi:MAG: sulfite exporter TauE/SafE family protein [Pseudomonadota bacterium]
MSATLAVTAALATGFMASGHCVGMCGPMAALGTGAGAASTPQRRIGRALAYNAARLLSYATVGALFGGLGHALGSAADIAQWSVVLRIGLGALMLIIGLRLLLARRRTSILERAGGRVWRRLAPLTRGLDPAGRTRDLFVLGLLWGYLPCGMVYSMLAVAALSGTAAHGALTMLAFGVGTLPAMVGLSLAGSRLAFLRRPGARRGFGAILMLSGLWMAAMPLYHALPSDASADHSHHAHHHMHH